MSASRQYSNVTSRSVSDANIVADSSKKLNVAYENHGDKKSKWRNLNPFFLKGYDMPLTIEEQLKKNEIKHSYNQKVPFNINRHVLLLLYFTLIVLTNRLFFGWPSLSNLLYGDEVYAWKCPKNPDGTYKISDNTKRYYCKEQDIAIQNIFIVGSSAYYAFSFFNGLIVDTVGSRLSMLLGHICNYIGWTLLLISTETFDAYIVGAIFIAASIDLGSFSTLNISGLYPSSENLIVNVISGAGSLSTGTMLLLDVIISQLQLSFKSFMFWYISSTVGIFFILTIFIFPRTRYFRQYEFDNYYKNYEKEMQGNVSDETYTNTLLGQEELEQGSTTVDNVNLNNLKKIHESINMDKGKSSSNVDLEKFHDEEKTERKQDVSSGSSGGKKKDNIIVAIKDIIKICTGLHFIGLWIYGPLNTIYNNLYFSIVENILSTSKNNMLAIMLPFSVIPCVILGNITDRFGIMIMIYYELFFAYAMYGLSYFSGNIWQVLAIISSTLYSACANGQLWTFISYTFSSRYVSTLIGILNLVSGLISLVRIKLMDVAKNNGYDFTYIKLLMISFIGINTLVTIYLVIIRKKFGKKVTIGDKMGKN